MAEQWKNLSRKLEISSSSILGLIQINYRRYKPQRISSETRFALAWITYLQAFNSSEFSVYSYKIMDVKRLRYDNSKAQKKKLYILQISKLRNRYVIFIDSLLMQTSL